MRNVEKLILPPLPPLLLSDILNSISIFQLLSVIDSFSLPGTFISRSVSYVVWERRFQRVCEIICVTLHKGRREKLNLSGI